MYSQRDEEKHILQFFKETEKGRFLDVGAYDGKLFSTTRALAQKGWGGVLVEPSPSVLPALRELYKDSPQHIIIEKGIGLESKTQLFYDSRGDAISSFDIDHKILWEKKGGTVYDEIFIEILSVDDLFAQIGYDFQFINLDAEAWSLDILEVLPFDKLTEVKMICVEFDHAIDRVMNAVEKHGFTLLHQTAENMLVVR